VKDLKGFPSEVLFHMRKKDIDGLVELSAKTGRNHQVLRNYFRRDQYLGLELARDIATALGISMEELTNILINHRKKRDGHTRTHMSTISHVKSADKFYNSGTLTPRLAG